MFYSGRLWIYGAESANVSCALNDGKTRLACLSPFIVVFWPLVCSFKAASRLRCGGAAFYVCVCVCVRARVCVLDGTNNCAVLLWIIGKLAVCTCQVCLSLTLCVCVCVCFSHTLTHQRVSVSCLTHLFIDIPITSFYLLTYWTQLMSAFVISNRRMTARQTRVARQPGLSAPKLQSSWWQGFC